jgi:hypothetical protein
VRYLARLLGVACAAALLSGCSLSGDGGGGGGGSRSSIIQTATFQYYNYLSATGSVDENPVTVELKAGLVEVAACPRPYDDNDSVSHALIIVGDRVSWNLLRCDNQAPIVSDRSQAVVAGASYTVLSVGDVVTGSGLDVVTFTQDRTKGPLDRVRVRFLHTLSQLNVLPVDVVVNGQTLVSGLGYKEASAYFEVSRDAPNGVIVSIQQGGVEIGRGVCVSDNGSNYEAALAYRDFNDLSPTVYCHAQ